MPRTSPRRPWKLALGVLLFGVALGSSAIIIGCATPTNPAVQSDQATIAQVQAQIKATTQSIATQTAALATQPSTGPAYVAATQALSTAQAQFDALSKQLAAAQAQEQSDVAALKTAILSSATATGTTVAGSLPAPWNLIAVAGVTALGLLGQGMINQSHTSTMVAATADALNTQSAAHQTIVNAALTALASSAPAIATTVAAALPAKDQAIAQIAAPVLVAVEAAVAGTNGVSATPAAK